MIGVCRVWKFRTLALPTPEQPAEATSWVRPARAGGYLQLRNIEVLGTYNRAGVLNGDREAAAVVNLAPLFGFETLERPITGVSFRSCPKSGRTSSGFVRTCRCYLPCREANAPRLDRAPFRSRLQNA